MEKGLFNPNDKEFMKMAMLKHEEAFREQVYELHRLYRIQKVLMKDIVSNRTPSAPQERNHEPVGNRADVERPVIENAAEEEDDDDNIELTLGTRSYSSQRKATAGRMTDSGLTFSSSSSGSSHVKRTRSSTGEEKWGGLDHQMAVSSSSNHQDSKLNNNSPWLFQALSLNMST